MIEELKDDKIISKVGGRFKLTALMQKRWVELMQGARPLVEPDNLNELEIIAKEIIEGKIAARSPDEPDAEEESSTGDDAE